VASHTISGALWADGVTVGVYPAVAVPAGSDVPSGSTVTSGVVSGGAVSFTGLSERVRYYAYGGGKGVGFLIPARSKEGDRARIETLEARRSLLNVYKTTGPGTSGTPVSVDLTTALASPSTTDTVQTTNMNVGPLPVVAGDLVDIHCRMEFTNPNFAEMVGGVHFHDTLPVMAALGVKRHTSIDVTAGSMILRQVAMNFTYYGNHHLVMDVREWWTVDVTGNYYLFNQFYFSSSAAFRTVGDTVLIEGGNYGLLEASHWR
jgi:hypothetical protein